MNADNTNYNDNEVINSEAVSLVEKVVMQLEAKKAKEREELQKSRIESFGELIELVTKLKQALPKAKKETEKFYKDNPKSFAIVFPTDEMKDTLTTMLEKLTGIKENQEEE